MNSHDLPIACTLTDDELQARRHDILKNARGAVTEVREIEDGFLYQFPSREGQLAELTRLIELEHKCCPFLRFQLTIEPGDGPIWLELSGPEGTKNFLRDLFN